MRVRKKKNLIKRLEACREYLVSEEKYTPGKWLPEGFSRLELEIGCGKGQFITQMAGENPDVFFIAVEREPEVLVMALEKAKRNHLRNLIFLSDDAARLGQIFAQGEISAMYINFCDPWPSGRHAKRRLTHRRQLVVYRDILSEGAKIYFKTDGGALFDFSIEELGQTGFEITFSTRDLHKDRPGGIMTEYEERFCSQSMPIYALEAVMGPLPDGFTLENKRGNPDPVLEDKG